MILEFKLSNWMSFKDENSFSMIAGDVSELQENVLNDEKNDLPILKSSVFYGANASGKSNLFEAIGYYKKMIISSQQNQSGDETQRKYFFLDSAYAKKPTTLEMTFLTNKNKMYKYGFSLDDKKIYKEWLELIKNDNETKNLMTRDTKEKKIGIDGTLLNEAVASTIINEIINENVLLLSLLGTLKGDIISEIIEYFRDVLVLDNTKDIRMSKDERLEINRNEKYKKQLMRLLRAADLGIEDVYVESRDIDSVIEPDRYVHSSWSSYLRSTIEEANTPLFTKHKEYKNGKETGKLIDTDYEEFESKGSIKLMRLAYKLINTINTGAVLIIDELDAGLHPLIMRAITKMFNSKFNERGQLLFTTHDTSLIEKDDRLFRRDQVWFTDKTPKEESILYSLYDFKYDEDTQDYKSIHKDENYAHNYLKGKYQGVPIIRDLFQIDWSESEDE